MDCFTNVQLMFGDVTVTQAQYKRLDRPVHLSSDADQVELADEHGEEGLEGDPEGGEVATFSPEHQVAAGREGHEYRAEYDAETREVAPQVLQCVRELNDVFVETQDAQELDIGEKDDGAYQHRQSVVVR